MMDDLNVRHYLEIYLARKNMQEEGITNPSPEIKKFTREFVEKLTKLPLDEKVKLENNTFYDSKGNLIAKIPSIDNE